MMYYHLGKDADGWAKVSWARMNMGADAYLCCPGPSLKNIDPSTIRGKGRKVYAINTAYPHINPDIWMGLDTVPCYDRQLWSEPFIKVCRGAHMEMKANDIPVKYFDNVFFAEMAEPEKGKTMFEYRPHESPLLWYKNTFASALHLMVWMGAKKIHLLGCDMGGEKDYYDDRVLSNDERTYNRELYRRQVTFLETLYPIALRHGVEFISCTKDSPINKIMPYKPIEEAIRESEEKVSIPSEEVNHALLTQKTAVVVPTRGDRPEFLKMCKKMISYQTRKPDAIYIIDRAPVIEGNDQRERIAEGVEKARKDGMHRIIVMEDDDYYPANYIETVLEKWGTNNMIGGYYFVVFHLKDKQHAEYNADVLTSYYKKCYGVPYKVAPLHSTGFTIAAWDKFIASEFYHKMRNLDEEIWAWAQKYNVKRDWIKKKMIISIKHGIGKCAGGNHQSISKVMAKNDPKMEFLQERVPYSIMSFYKKVAK